MGIESLIDTFDDRYLKRNASDIPSIVFGTITRINPIELRLANSQQVIKSNLILLSSLVTANTPGGERLGVGDQVVVLKINGGQLFYIIEKRNFQPVRHCNCEVK